MSIRQTKLYKGTLLIGGIILVSYSLIKVMPQNLCASLLVFLLIVIALKNKINFTAITHKRITISTLVFSFFLAVCLLIGASFNETGSLDYILGTPFRSAIILLGCWIGACHAISFALSFADYINQQTKKPSIEKGGTARLIDSKPFLMPFIACLICWLPYWLIFFPGGIITDGAVQLANYFGEIEISNHHPIFSTLVIGWLAHFGRFVLNDNFAIFSVNLFNHLLGAFSCGLSMLYLKRWGISRPIRVVALCLWLFNPCVVVFYSMVSKDSIAMSLQLLYGLFFLELIRSVKLKIPYRNTCILLFASGIVLSLFRQQNIYVVVFSVIAVAIFKQSLKQRITWFALGIVSYICITLTVNGLMWSLQAEPGSIREALSIPFQQTARYVRDHGDDVSEQEKAAIDAVLEYDKLAEYYYPPLSNRVKETYREDESALPAYFKTWLSMLPRHPRAYIEATLANSYSYLAPNGNNFLYSFQYYGEISPFYYEFSDFFNLNYAFISQEQADKLREDLFVVNQIPFLNATFYVGHYTWLILFLLLLVWQKNKHYAIVGFFPALISIASYIASPVNGDGRYYIATAVTVPLLIAWSLSAAYSMPNEKVPIPSDIKATENPHKCNEQVANIKRRSKKG